MFGRKLHPVRSALSASTVALFAAAFAATPALAGGPRISIGVEFQVPARLEVRARHHAYRVGHAWFGPHAHAHVIYAFPVRTAFGVAYRPFTYCDDRLVRSDFVPGFDPRYDDLRIGYELPVFDGPAYFAGYLAPEYYDAPWRGGRHRHAVAGYGRRGDDFDDDRRGRGHRGKYDDGRRGRRGRECGRDRHAHDRYDD